MRRPPFACPCCEPCRESPGAGRRAVFRATLGTALAVPVLAVPALAARALAAPPTGTRRLAVTRMQTGDGFDGVFWRDGRYDREALSRLDWVFRDLSREEATPMDPRLFDLMHALAGRLDAGGPFQVVSGYRAPETNAARARQSGRVSHVSLHMSGMAADVRLPDRSSVALARLAAEMQVGGVGLYRRDGFVHLDCGPSRRW